MEIVRSRRVSRLRGRLAGLADVMVTSNDKSLTVAYNNTTNEKKERADDARKRRSERWNARGIQHSPDSLREYGLDGTSPAGYGDPHAAHGVKG